MATATTRRIYVESDIVAYIATLSHLAPKTRKVDYYLLKAFQDRVDNIEDPIACLAFFSGITNPNTYNHNRAKVSQYRAWLGLPPLDVKKRKSQPREAPIEQIKLSYNLILSGVENSTHHLALSMFRWSGIRAGELLGLRPNDIEFDEHSCILNVLGKTGRRRIRVLEITAETRTYLNSRAIPPTSKIFNMSYNALWSDIKRACKRVGAPLAISPHLLRHLRATEMATSLKEPEMRVYFGWSRSSEMPAVYVHLSGQDCNDKILQLAGIQASQGQNPTSRVCPRCHSPNPTGHAFCGLCGTNLDGVRLDLQREIQESPTDALIKRLESRLQELEGRMRVPEIGRK